MTLHRLGHTPGSRAETDWHNTLANTFTALRGKVCSVCGLGGVGHSPETQWLGNEPHPFEGITATPEQLAHADKLTTDAYRANRENGTHTHCGHRYGNPQCRAGNCIHLGGHCEHCE